MVKADTYVKVIDHEVYLVVGCQRFKLAHEYDPTEPDAIPWMANMLEKAVQTIINHAQAERVS